MKKFNAISPVNCENFEFHADGNPDANYCKNHVVTIELETLCNMLIISKGSSSLLRNHDTVTLHQYKPQSADPCHLMNFKYTASRIKNMHVSSFGKLKFDSLFLPNNSNNKGLIFVPILKNFIHLSALAIPRNFVSKL